MTKSNTTTKITKTTGKISKISKLTPSVHHFTLNLNESISYESGQFITLGVQINNKKIKRSYSIVSSPNGNSTNEYSIELCIKHVNDGIFTPILFSDTIKEIEFEIIGPLGLFKLKDIHKPQIFIGAGTGVAPLRSFILDLLKNKKCESQITLLLGIRYDNQILYNEEFKQLEKDFSNFIFIPTISRPSEEWTGKIGYVQNHIKGLSQILDSQYYICGLNNLVENCITDLQKLGVEKENIKFEKYG